MALAMSLSRPGRSLQGSAQEALGQADETEFDRLFNQHWSPLCRLLYHIVGDWDEAQDLALETFEQLHRNPPKDPANLAGWLYRVGSNLGLNALRAGQRRQHYEARASAAFSQEATPDDPAQSAERSQERQVVREVLAKLKPRTAHLLILRHSGMTYAEIAATLSLSPGSVGTLLARAEREFEKQYRKHRME
jgi:RNA polymerase sigma-70 factor (ECF subfamily)